MHQDDVVILQFLLCTIDAVDVVGLIVDRVVDKRDLERKMQEIAIIDQDLVIVPRGHHDFLDPVFHALAELAAEDGVAMRDFGHAFRMFAGEDTHAMAEAGVENQRFHLFRLLIPQGFYIFRIRLVRIEDGCAVPFPSLLDGWKTHIIPINNT